MSFWASYFLRKNPSVDSTINQAKDVISASWQNNGARLNDLTNVLNNFWGSDETSDDVTHKDMIARCDNYYHDSVINGIYKLM